jgi:DNA polymerase-1
MVLFWDTDEGPVERRKIYADYKKKTNDPEYLAIRANAVQQRKFLQYVLGYLGVDQYIAPGWEADDAIGSFLENYASDSTNGYEPVTIISNDKDLYQLLEDQYDITILRPINNGNYERINSKNCESEFGVVSTLVPMYKAMVGDKSDNIPGIKGIGPKKALKIFKEWYGIAKFPIYDHPLIKNNKEIFQMCHKLAQINTYARIMGPVPVVKDLEKAKELLERCVIDLGEDLLTLQSQDLYGGADSP